MNQKLKITPSEQRILDQLADHSGVTTDLLRKLGVKEPIKFLMKLTDLGMAQMETIQFHPVFNKSTGKWIVKPEVIIKINQNLNKENITYERNYTRNETN